MRGVGGGGPADTEPVEVHSVAATFFWGWNMMMWTLGANMQPSTTKPLRLTDIHMVVV